MALDGYQFPEGLSGVVVAAHSGESNYTRRVRNRLFKEAARQLPLLQTGWVALYWTNGAPIAAITKALRSGFPKHIEGVILVGDAIFFPSRVIHCFTWILPANSFDTEGVTRVASEANDARAQNILDGFERSSGVRATLLTALKDGCRTELLRRDGRRRILPFNLLLGVDPPYWASTRQGSTQFVEDRRSTQEAADVFLRPRQGYLVGTSAHESGLLVEPSYELVAPGRNPRNRPCPCGSSKKYKHCHGS